MKKYKDLYEEEKQRHEEALQRYQEDHMDEMEIIKLHKRRNKRATQIPRPKKASEPDEPKKASELDEPKKVSRLIDDLSKEEQQKLKKTSGSSNKGRRKS